MQFQFYQHKFLIQLWECPDINLSLSRSSCFLLLGSPFPCRVDREQWIHRPWDILQLQCILCNFLSVASLLSSRTNLHYIILFHLVCWNQELQLLVEHVIVSKHHLSIPKSLSSQCGHLLLFFVISSQIKMITTFLDFFLFLENVFPMFFFKSLFF